MTERDDQDVPRVIDLSVEVPGTPEEVWRAVATGPGISSWFIPHEVAEHEGGAVTMNFGPAFGKETATVEAWEPPHRVVFRGPAEQSLAYEWLVEAKDGGTCVVRLVNSGFGSGADWDGQYDGMTEGWQLFMENLRLHLTHFAGERAQAVIPVGMTPGPNRQAFSALCDALGISAELERGDRVTTSGPDVPAVAGTLQATKRIAKVSAYFLLLDAPMRGTAFLAAEGDGDQVSVCAYLYLYGGDVSSDEAEWTAFVAERFPMPQPAEV